MRHDIERVRAEIEKFHDDPPDSGDLDLDDFTLIALRIDPYTSGRQTIEISRYDGEFALQLVGAHSFTQPRVAVLEWARVLGPDDLWPDEDRRYDLAALRIERELPTVLQRAGSEPSIPPHAAMPLGRPLYISLAFVKLERLDLVLVFDRHPLPSS